MCPSATSCTKTSKCGTPCATPPCSARAPTFRKRSWKRASAAPWQTCDCKGKNTLRIRSLSGGQKKRVSIATELLSDPKILFLDEPTSGLSPDLDMEMMELLRELAKKGRTVIVITHAMENLDKCDRVAFLGRGGRLCYYGGAEGAFRWFNRRSYSRIFAALTDEATSDAFARKYRRSANYRALYKTFSAAYGKTEMLPPEQEKEVSAWEKPPRPLSGGRGTARTAKEPEKTNCGGERHIGGKCRKARRRKSRNNRGGKRQKKTQKAPQRDLRRQVSKNPPKKPKSPKRTMNGARRQKDEEIPTALRAHEHTALPRDDAAVFPTDPHFARTASAPHF